MTEHYDVVWRPTPEQAAATHAAAFMAAHGITDFEALRTRSTADPDWFWSAVVDYLGLPFDRRWRAVRDTSRGEPWTTWFTGAMFNVSRACVDRWADVEPRRLAVRSQREDGTIEELTFGELRDQVAAFAGGLHSLGVRRGDAVAIFLPMSWQAVAALLGTARIGAIAVPIFSGYGAEAVAGRLTDPKPKVVVCADEFQRRGRRVAMKEVADRAIDQAGGVENVIVADSAGQPSRMEPGRDVTWSQLVGSATPLAPVPTGSEDPFLLAYTSGTTGTPKGAVHVQAGFTTQVAAEGAFQFDIHREDVVMWATDIGWIMGPWVIVAALANGAAVATYDGAPDHPGPDRLWRIAEELDVSVLGVSPTLIRSLKRSGADEAAKHDLGRLRAFGSTGEPWNPDPWWWLFQEVGAGKRPIINISGGTEIGACLVSVNVLQGIKPTSVGGPALGVGTDIVDGAGNSVRGEVGELAVRGSWPGRTRGFWNDPKRYLATYWERFEGIWVHGDWASVDEEGFWYLQGRSDDTLNIAGKRIGPAEIESLVVGLPEVAMAAAVGIPDEVKGEAIALFVVPAAAIEPDQELTDRVEQAVVDGLGKAFRPSAIRWVGDLPRTRSAKIMRRVVRALAVGEEAGDLSSLENPESLDGIAPVDR